MILALAVAVPRRDAAALGPRRRRRRGRRGRRGRGAGAAASLLPASWQRAPRASRGRWLRSTSRPGPRPPRRSGRGSCSSCSPAARSSSTAQRPREPAPPRSRPRPPLAALAIGGGVLLLACLGRLQGRRAVLRRRLRDHPAHAGRRGRPLPLDDERRVPQRRRARPDHARDRWCTPWRSSATPRPASAVACWPRPSRSRPRSRSSCSAAGTSTAARRPRARAFLDGAGPAAIGAILGSAIPLARALDEPWQYAVLAAAARCSCWPCAAGSCRRCCCAAGGRGRDRPRRRAAARLRTSSQHLYTRRAVPPRRLEIGAPTMRPWTSSPSSSPSACSPCWPSSSKGLERV